MKINFLVSPNHAAKVPFEDGGCFIPKQVPRMHLQASRWKEGWHPGTKHSLKPSFSQEKVSTFKPAGSSGGHRECLNDCQRLEVPCGPQTMTYIDNGVGIFNILESMNCLILEHILFSKLVLSSFEIPWGLKRKADKERKQKEKDQKKLKGPKGKSDTVPETQEEEGSEHEEPEDWDEGWEEELDEDEYEEWVASCLV